MEKCATGPISLPLYFWNPRLWKGIFYPLFSLLFPYKDSHKVRNKTRNGLAGFEHNQNAAPNDADENIFYCVGDIKRVEAGRLGTGGDVDEKENF